MNKTNHPTRPLSTSAFLSTRNVVLAGMFAALLAIISQISLPMPSGVPITLQIFGVALAGTVLGWRLALFSTVAYILIGAAGAPVFANFHGGIGALTGVTGGYIWAWPIMAALCGIKLPSRNKKLCMLGSILLALIGLAIDETVGGLQWASLSGTMTIWGVFTYSMVAFVPKDIVLTILAVILGHQVRKPLVRSGYLN